ncbi:uncharacterized protein [Amphiura filiformis]|uniref:uncharacterized protein n=1 Tax=Amphiura filiformis TaxID=82378 RepID=UPI003B21E838
MTEDEIRRIDNVDILNAIIQEDDWQTDATRLAYNRILQLREMERDDTDPVGNVPMDSMVGGENPVPVLPDVDETIVVTGSRKRPAENSVDDLRETEEQREESDDLSRYYNIEAVNTKRVKKYKASATDYRLRLRNLDEVALDALPLLSGIIDDVLHNLTLGIRPRDMVRIILQAPGLDKPIALPFIKKDDLTIDRFMARVEHVLQSNKDVKLNSDMDINFVHMEMPEGGRSDRPMFQTWEEKKENLYCIVPISNQSDNMCLARAIVTGKANHELKSTGRVWRDIRRGGHHQTTRATALHEEIKMPFKACGLEHVEAFQQVVSDYQLVVVSKEQFDKIIWKGPNKSKGIYLLYNNNHFDLITSMSAYLNRSYWCHECKVAYNDKRRHECEKTCKVCHSGNCQSSDEIEAWTYCTDCNRYFKSLQCYENHKADGSSVKKFGTICSQYYKCEKCERVVNKKYLQKGKIHDCTDIWCRVCIGNFKVGHRCFIKKVEVKEKEENPFSYIFFDVESQMETGIHKACLCVAQKVCETCADRPIEDACDFCGDDKQVVFRGKDCMEEFCLWVLKNERHKRAICLAHNLKGYDGYFILQYLYDNNVKPDVIMNGAKVMSITVPKSGIVFKDSLNFFPMALSKLPKSFGIQELCKGFYPHLKNTKANENYRGKLPDMEDFDPEGMSEAGKQEFVKWYEDEKKKGKEWVLQDELLKYCINDVDILRRCCMQFRTMFMEVTKTGLEDPGVDPLKDPITIAAACNLVLRRNFLEPQTIAIIPPHGYGPGQNFSRDSIVWLNYEAMKDGDYILHAMNGGEAQLYGRVTADGIDLENRKIYSYHGCLFHGCRSCFDEDTINPISGKPMAELYRKTLLRRKQLELNYPDYEIVEIFEHDWKKTWKGLPDDVRKRIDVSRHLEPMDCREALYGGRTETNKLFHKVADGEVIRYLDFTR